MLKAISPLLTKIRWGKMQANVFFFKKNKAASLQAVKISKNEGIC